MILNFENYLKEENDYAEGYSRAIKRITPQVLNTLKKYRAKLINIETYLNNNANFNDVYDVVLLIDSLDRIISGDIKIMKEEQYNKFGEMINKYNNITVVPSPTNRIEYTKTQLTEILNKKCYEYNFIAELVKRIILHMGNSNTINVHPYINHILESLNKYSENNKSEIEKLNYLLKFRLDTYFNKYVLNK
jgi:hypothetical protein